MLPYPSPIPPTASSPIWSALLDLVSPSLLYISIYSLNTCVKRDPRVNPSDLQTPAPIPYPDAPYLMNQISYAQAVFRAFNLTQNRLLLSPTSSNLV